MAGATSLEAVKRKIKFLQEQADVAEEKSERLQKELLAEKAAREQVSIFFCTARQARQECILEENDHLFARHLPLPFLCVAYPPFMKQSKLR